MSKTKLDNRIENAVNAFFETGSDASPFAMTYTGQDSALVAVETPFTEKADKWLRVLREVFMFGPGTFALFYSSLTLAFDTPGVGPKVSTYLFAIFLTYAGCGSLKSYKNLAVPASVVALAFATVFIATSLLGRDLADMYFWDSIYLLPFVLVVAKLVQSWVADKS